MLKTTSHRTRRYRRLRLGVRVPRERVLSASRIGRAEEYEHAAVCFAEILRIRSKTLGEEDPLTLGAMLDRLKVAVLADRWYEVEPFGREYYEAHVRVRGEDHPDTLRCVRRLVEGYEAEADEEQAEAWRAKLPGGG